MSDISRRRSLRFFFLLITIFIQFSCGFSDDSNFQEDRKVSSSSNNNGSTIFIICIALAAVVGLSSYLYKLWQKKKHKEQHARLLKLFEEDDELDLELGD